MLSGMRLGCSCVTFGWLAAVGMAAQTSPAAGHAEHVAVVVWDGMRPDFISPENTPTLWRMAQEGVRFRNHHAVYVTSTEVNGTALATGCYPDHSGIIANREYRPEINWLEPVATEGVDTIRRSDIQTGGRYLAVPTLAESLHRAGFTTAVAGTKPVALLQDRARGRTLPAALQSTMLYNGHALPASALAPVLAINGQGLPPGATPNEARDLWTTRGLTRALWKDSVPKFSLLWLSEPDASQHAKSPGSPTALAALAGNDRNLARVLRRLEQKGVRQKTDVLLVSDHGFSSIERGVDVAEALDKAGFKAARALDDPEPGEILVDGLGGTVMFYVMGHDEAVTQRLVRFLQASDFAGVICSRLPRLGAFSLNQLHLDSDRTHPDVVLSMRWSSRPNKFGAPGTLVGDGGRKGRGTHASLSPYDLHNTLVAWGPDFRRGFVDDLPTGNADIAPTVLWLLGVRDSHKRDGRVMFEALAGMPETEARPEQTTIQAGTELEKGHWRQYLKFTTLGNQIYFDEGNGEETR